MIAYIRGRLDGPANAREVAIDTEDGRIVARTFSPSGALGLDDDVVAASATIAVGVDDRDATALLGAWAPDRPDPAGPLGLGSTPVILVPDRSAVEVAIAGVARAGRAPTVARLEGRTPGLGLALLAAGTAGADVIALVEATGRHIDLVRILGGRPVVALTACDAPTVATWFRDAELGAEIAVPTSDERVSRELSSLGLEARHQLVQVDPRPALDEAGVGSNSALGVLTAGAAGVLAGRIAAGNRRWRAALEP